MKIQRIINLVRYHAENNDNAFTSEVAAIASEFDAAGDTELAQYLMDLVSRSGYFVPQSDYGNFKWLKKINYAASSLYLPDSIEEDVFGVARAIQNPLGLSAFLFYGAPGTGKTESVYQIARLLNRDILAVNAAQLIDSHLGESAKNIDALFDEINHLPTGRALILFDEIDAIVLDRVNSNDLREMGRVTSAFLRALDERVGNVPLIATTNLYNNFDKAIVRRFDAVISFDRYAKADLIDIANLILAANLKNAAHIRKDKRLFTKILNNAAVVPYPGDLKRIIKSAIAFSDTDNPYDYLRKLYLALADNPTEDIHQLKARGYTTREIEILTKVSKSSVSRKLRNNQ